MRFLDKYFLLSENKTDFKTEALAGLITFMTMAYIIFTNPAILKNAGLPFQETVVATCLASGLVTLIMGLYANYPFALASGMGINAALAFLVVEGTELTWQIKMGIIVLEGALVAILVLTNLREAVMNSIPLSLKRAIGVGIGLFIALIGMKDAGYVVAHPATFVTFGPIHMKPTLIATAGLFLTMWLLMLRLRVAILLGILGTAALAIFAGVTPMPEKLISLPPAPTTLFQFDIFGALKLSLIPVIFSFFMVDFFDTMGTVIAVGGKGRFLDSEGRLPRLKKVLLADSLGAVLGGVFSASSVTTYIESASGVSQGGRTGLASVFTALCFFAALFFTPLVSIVGGGYRLTETLTLYPITAPALIIVGFLMMTVITEIDWQNMEEAFPAFLTILTMPLTFSISRGIGFGCISFALLKLLRGKPREAHPLLYGVSLLFILSFLV